MPAKAKLYVSQAHKSQLKTASFKRQLLATLRSQMKTAPYAPSVSHGAVRVQCASRPAIVVKCQVKSAKSFFEQSIQITGPKL